MSDNQPYRGVTQPPKIEAVRSMCYTTRNEHLLLVEEDVTLCPLALR